MKSKYSGYMGKVMIVDLTTETVSEYPWSDELYLGGKIMAARILCDHLTGKETAFSDENWVVISTGPLTGTGAPSSARFNISALSPQTGILASSNCGANEAEKVNAFIRWIEETNEKMGLPDKFDVVQDKDIDQMITWGKKEANPLYPVPVVWARKDFRRLIESIRK